MAAIEDRGTALSGLLHAVAAVEEVDEAAEPEVRGEAVEELLLVLELEVRHPSVRLVHKVFQLLADLRIVHAGERMHSSGDRHGAVVLDAGSLVRSLRRGRRFHGAVAVLHGVVPKP